jgi:hypothetical protein
MAFFLVITPNGIRVFGDDGNEDDDEDDEIGLGA